MISTPDLVAALKVLCPGCSAGLEIIDQEDGDCPFHRAVVAADVTERFDCVATSPEDGERETAERILAFGRKAHEDGRLAGLEEAQELACARCAEKVPMKNETTHCLDPHRDRTTPAPCKARRIRARASELRKERGE
jgi:hypothetical protein